LNTSAAAARIQTPDDLCTPTVVLEALRPLGPIHLDPCSNPWSIVPALHKLDGSSPEQDGLGVSWRELAGDGLVYVNAPYGRGHTVPWAEKVARETRAGCEIVDLVKGDHSTEWWRMLREHARAIAYWRGRIGFLGGSHGSGNFASSLLYFGQRPHLFAHALEAYADVRVL